MIKLGDIDLNKLYLGNTEIGKNYLKDILVYGEGSAPPPPPIDSDASAFLTAAVISDPTIVDAINDLVLSLKSSGIWSKMIAFWPFVGGTAASHKWNLKDPRDLRDAFRLEYIGGVTHDSLGMKGNGTNGYAITFNNFSHFLIIF
jgi:hypothetical protein